MLERYRKHSDIDVGSLRGGYAAYSGSSETTRGPAPVRESA